MPNTEEDLRKFLVTGRLDGKYIAGSFSSFEFDPAFWNVAVDLERADKITALIALCKSETSLKQPSIFALAALIKSLPRGDDTLDVRQHFYKVVPNILLSTEEFMLFNKYMSDLGMKKGTVWQKCLRSWYQSCNFHTLLTEGAENTWHGWTHKDVLNIMHRSNLSPAQTAFCKYLYVGAQAAEGVEYAPKDLLCSMKKLERLSKTDCEREAASIIKSNTYVKIVHVPRLFHTYPLVLRELIRRMDLPQIVSTLKYLSPKVWSKVEDTIKSQFQKSTHPLFSAYVTFLEYEKICTYLVKNQIQISRFKDSLSDPIRKSLLGLLERRFKSVTTEINQSCLITIDLRDCMFLNRKARKVKLENSIAQSAALECPAASSETSKTKKKLGKINKTSKGSLSKIRLYNSSSKCHYTSEASPGEAAILLAVFASKFIKNTDVAICTDEGIKITSLFEKASEIFPLVNFSHKAKELKCKRFEGDMPLIWALKNAKNYDIFINVTDRIGGKKKSVDLSMALENYQLESKKNAKVIAFALSSRNVQVHEGVSSDILHVAGFDEHLPDVIKNFVEH